MRIDRTHGARRRLGAPFALGAGAVLMAAGLAVAASPVPVDLTTLNASADVNGAVLQQSNFEGSTGTGVFDSFVRIQQSGTEQGYNTSGRPVQYNELTSPFTRDLLLSEVPLVDRGGTMYREFRLDINEVNSTPDTALLSLDQARLFVSTIPSITGADPASPTFGQAAGTTSLVWDLDGDGNTWVNLNYALAPGSGNGDMYLYVPNADFGAAGTACPYGVAGCSYYVYLYSQMGVEKSSSDGFEEWSVRKTNAIAADKTADPTWKQTNAWDITKSVDPTEHDLFAGDAASSGYDVVVTKTVTSSDFAVSGRITVSNSGTTNKSAIRVQPDEITDAIKLIATDTQVATGTITSCTYNGQAVSLTQLTKLNDGELLVCSYSASLASGILNSWYSNTATIPYYEATGPTSTPAGTLTAYEEFQFTDDNKTVVGPPTVAVTDTFDGGAPEALGMATSSTSFEYDRSFACPTDLSLYDANGTYSYTKPNTAKLLDGATVIDSADASVAVDCYALQASKDATTSYTRTFNWTIDKSVTPDTWNLFDGDSGTSQFTVAVTKTGYTDGDWAVDGNISVHNPAPIAATVNSVTDVVSPAIAGTVDCGVTFPYTLAAGGTLACTYETGLPDGTTRTNTATATIQNYDDGVESGSTGFSGSADVTFGAPTTIVDESINVDDTNGGSWAFGDSGSVSYSKTFACDADEGTYDNTATIRETGLSDGASVDVNCYALSVSKDADTSFTREWDWTIDKTGDQAALTLAVGQSFVVNYQVKVDAAKTDSDHAVAGAIRISNPAPMAATINGVADLVSPDIAASVDCGVTFPYSLAAGGELVCSYSADLPGKADRTNTATATLQNYDYDKDLVATADGTTDFSGTADVSFAEASINEIDECIDLGDSKYGDLGTVCADQAPKTFTYSLTVGPYEACGLYDYVNTASFTTNDTGATGDDSWTVAVDVPCLGCTLTQGYWKTHSELGPAPYDDTWALLPNGASTPFYLSGQTWYQVFWTAPGGNVYYNLAHQYMAAKLNVLNDAGSTPAVDAAIASAHTLFNTYTPAQVGAWKGQQGARAQFVNLAGILGGYNEGMYGPGHCSE